MFAFTAEASDVVFSSLEREIETVATGDFSSFCVGNELYCFSKTNLKS